MTSNLQVHGHAVIHLVEEHPEGIPRQRLVESIEAEFGPGVRFRTCSVENMTVTELFAFLAERNKIEIRSEVIFPGGSPACG